MSHFAQVIDGIVQKVITAEQDFVNQLPNPIEWIQTSYNTHGNVHTLGGTPLRGNYAGVGHTYDSVNDVFYSPQPFPSWSLNTSTWTWSAPVAYPVDGKQYWWDESITNWVEVPQ